MKSIIEVVAMILFLVFAFNFKIKVATPKSTPSRIASKVTTDELNDTGKRQPDPLELSLDE